MNIKNVNGIGAVDITPFKVKYNDSEDTTMLQLYIAGDNFLDSASLQWKLLTASGKETDNGVLPVTGDNYSGWDGTAVYAFSHVATYMNLTIL